MAVYAQDLNAAKSSLWPEETVHVTATQRLIGPGGALINPTTVVATDKRLLIINRATLGARKDIETIPYNSIASVRLENGLISSSVFIQVAGYVSPKGSQGFLKAGESEGEIPGLRRVDAKALSDFLTKVISGVYSGPPPATSYNDPARGMPGRQVRQQQNQQQSGQPPSSTGGGGAAIYCQKCGAKNPIDAQFCIKCGTRIGK